MRLKRMIIFILIIYSAIIINEDIKYSQMKVHREKTISELNEKFNNEIKQVEENQQGTVVNKDNIDANRMYIQDIRESENVIGKILIDKLDLEYPILENSTDENLNLSITRFWGSKINCIGNCVLAGHNMRDGSLFGRLSKLSENDKMTLIDASGNIEDYTIFNIKVVEPDDLTVLEQTNYKMITLITCTNNGKKRLIVQAKN